MTIEEKIRYSTAKLRNIIYYRLVVEEQCCAMNDERYDRFRCQYMHVLRRYRKSLLTLVEEIPNDDPRKSWFLGIIKLISPKVKSDECKDTIKRLKDYCDGNVR